MSAFPDWAHNLSRSLTGKDLHQHASALKAALPAPAKNVMTDSKVSSAFGAPPEPAGMTMTGGRRKTRGGKRRGKKTVRGGKRR